MTAMRRVGVAALLLECDDANQVEAWRRELHRRRDTGSLVAAEIVPGARTVLLDGVPDVAALADRIATWPPPPAAEPAAGQLLDIPVLFDGPDLPFVASLWGVDVVERLCTTQLRVAFCGFSPGFAYLTGLPSSLAVPRLDSPRSRVPAGSVGLAGPYVGIYPTASPGGWRLVGRTDLVLFDTDRDPPALLTPGTRVSLAPSRVDQGDLSDISRREAVQNSLINGADHGP
jgi:KipI family sensor histidine kinase inhibitor